jgi:hypothetical protein
VNDVTISPVHMLSDLSGKKKRLKNILERYSNPRFAMIKKMLKQKNDDG